MKKHPISRSEFASIRKMGYFIDFGRILPTSFRKAQPLPSRTVLTAS